MKCGYKVSYKKDWDKKCNYYNQMITLYINPDILSVINQKIALLKHYNKNDKCIQQDYCQLKEGKNYVTFYFRNYIIDTFLEETDKIKRNRRTIINIKFV